MQNENPTTILSSNGTDSPASSQEIEQPATSTVQAVQSAPQPRRCPPEPAEMKEIVRRGWEIYEQSIRAQVEPQHIGKFMSIDVDTG